MILQPRQQTPRVKAVPAWHEHRFFPDRKIFDTHWAHWALDFAIIGLLAVLPLNPNDWQLFHASPIRRCPLTFLLRLLHLPNDVCKEVVSAVE